VHGTRIVMDGRPMFVATVNDVTECRRLEAAVHAESERLQLVMLQVPAFVWTTDTQLAYTSYKGSIPTLLGESLSTMVGRSALCLANSQSPVEEIQRRYRSAIEGKPTHYEYVSDGRTFDCHLQPLHDASGTITGTIGIAVEITERKRMDEAASKREAALAAGQELAHLGSWEYDPNTDIFVWSHELYEIMDHPISDDALNGHAFWEHVYPDDLDMVRRAFAESMTTGKRLRVEYRIIRRDGGIRWLHSTGEMKCDAEGRVQRIFGAVLDITDRKLAEDRLEHLSLHDPLTELPNRLHAEQFIARVIAEAARQKRSVAVLSLDIDRFKTINEGLGHAVGDELLKAMPERLRPCIRTTDLIARLGGDSYLVVLADIEGVADAAEVAKRILRKTADPFAVANRALSLTVSIGVSIWPSGGSLANILIANAESAMFAAKELGRNRVEFCRVDQQALAVERLSLEQDLRRAVERDEFVLWYQPIIDFKTGAIVAAEALLRWQHPTRGLLAPDRFIPLAEETGLIIPIGDRALYSAACQVGSWRAQGFDDLCVTVNVAKAQLQNDFIVESVRRVLDLTCVDPSAITLEITESGIMSNPEAATTLAMLKAQGVGLSMDDFGTGYSSLAYLKNFPIDILKIDRSFIRDLTTNPSDAAIASTIVALGHNLRMSVIAEGVETREQFDLVRAMGCDAMQGFYYARPMRAEDFTAMLSSDRRVFDEASA
jgi:diguanylate cyclase (GGDEF)-like protein/PAS domain S-box-containing protein